mmetsp:Transcript_23191/g.87782  ORF Transcript_23191/g.87782 Transcript_23191/m.87782 type:complete len:341 (-) Transcript_23191:386-1408(-)
MLRFHASADTVRPLGAMHSARSDSSPSPGAGSVHGAGASLHSAGGPTTVPAQRPKSAAARRCWGDASWSSPRFPRVAIAKPALPMAAPTPTTSTHSCTEKRTASSSSARASAVDSLTHSTRAWATDGDRPSRHAVSHVSAIHPAARSGSDIHWDKSTSAEASSTACPHALRHSSASITARSKNRIAPLGTSLGDSSGELHIQLLEHTTATPTRQMAIAAFSTLSATLASRLLRARCRPFTASSSAEESASKVVRAVPRGGTSCPLTAAHARAARTARTGSSSTPPPALAASGSSLTTALIASWSGPPVPNSARSSSASCGSTKEAIASHPAALAAPPRPA